MNYLNLSQIKKHLNIDSDFTADDTYITMLADVVEVAVQNEIDDDFKRLKTVNGGSLPMPLIQAMLLLIGVFYANRESVAFAGTYNVNYTYQYLTDQYRNYGRGTGQISTDIVAEIEAQIDALNKRIDDADFGTLQGEEPIEIAGEKDRTISLGNINLGEY